MASEEYQKIKQKIFPGVEFHPVVELPESPRLLDFTRGYQPENIRGGKWGIGRYNERRPGMYTAPQYDNRRCIHMGIDIWCPPKAPVYAAWDGEVTYMADNAERGNYGPTIILRHQIGDHLIFALHGHLSRESLSGISRNDFIPAGYPFAGIGSYEENGNWEPHLHYQLSWKDPGRADMPGVVADDDHEAALKIYPDPRLILGDIY